MKKIIFLSFLGIIALQADQIKSIDFKGLVHLSTETAREISGLKVGESLDNNAVDRAIINLFKQGYFKDILVQDDNGNITIILKEKPSIAKVDLKGVVSNDQKAIKELVGIKPGNMYDELAVERTIEKIRQFYEAKGYFDTVVDVEKVPVDGKEDSLFVTLNINRGENMIIQKVNLINAKELDYDDIEPIIANKSREALGWMWGRNDGKVKLTELPSDSARIQDKYFQKGYLDATVSTPFLDSYFNNYKANLTYYIYEGKPYKIDTITINAPDWLEIDKDRIIKNFKLEKGDTINSAKLRDDLKSLEDQVANKGYAFVKVYPKTTKHQETQKVDIEYEIDAGDKVYVRNVEISGNERTVDRVVRRELYLTEGDLYNRTDLQDSIDALKRTGYFESAEIVEKRVNKDTIDLLVVVKEASTGSISGGIGYGSSDGLLLNANVADSNIFGSGMRGSINVDRSDNELSGQIGLTNPRIFDSEYSLGGTIYANDYSRNNYKEKSYGFNATLGKKLTRNLSASLTYVIEESKISGLSNALLHIGYKEGKNLKSSIIPSLNYNSTDDYFLPRKGIIASTSLEFAGIGGDEKFLKSRSSFNWYFGLRDYIDYDFILRYKASFNKVWDLGYVPINEKLYLGGIANLRGYDSRSVSPKVHYRGDWYETGGGISFNNSVELSFPIINRINMRGVLFYDYGMIGDHSLTQIQRSSTGVGIEWITPIGPLQLVFAKALNPASNDDTSSFEFSVGRRF